MVIAQILAMILPTSIFGILGLGKIRHPRRHLYKLAELGSPRLARTWAVRLVGTTEVAIAVAAAMSIAVAPVLVAPMLLCLTFFTGVLLIKRPRECGCGPALSWGPASVRNGALAGLALLAVSI